MSESVSKPANVFRSRNYRLVFFGALVSELGALLYSFAVSFYILQISGNNAFLQGLYLALCSVAMLIFTPRSCMSATSARAEQSSWPRS